MKITTSTSGEKAIFLPVELDKDSDWSIEWEIAKLGTSQNFATAITHDTNGSKWINFFNTIGTNIGTNTGNTSGWSETNVSSSVSVGTVCKYEYINGVLTLKYDSNTLKSNSVTLINPIKFKFYTNQNRVQYIKNIKIKPL